MAQDITGALEALGLDRFHLVGVSLGGDVAVHMAASAGDAVASLVLCGVGLTPDQALEDEVYGIQEAVHYLADEDFAEQIGEALLIPDAPQAGIDNLRSGIAALGKRHYLDALKAMVISDLSGVSLRVSAPTLVLHGDLEELVPLEQARALAEALPNGALQRIKDAGHIAYLDNPKAFAESLGAFLGTQRAL
jgi:3-oxoadipate enol-lactonase